MPKNINVGSFGSTVLSITGLSAVLVAGSGAGTLAMAQAVSNDQIEEIIVTARRREENIQSIPVAVTAFSAEQIRERSIQQAQDLTRFVPSFAMAQIRRTDQTNVTIRGLPGVVAYIAEVPVSTFSGTGLMYDMDSVQVLAGPQGTLFGRNSTGGAVLFVPKRPQDAVEGFAQGTLGNYSRRQITGAINVPLLSGKVLLRAAADLQDRDGFTKDMSSGKDLDDRHYYAWRASMVLKPVDGFENYTLYSGYDEHANGASNILETINPNSTVTRLFPQALGFLSQQQALGRRAILGRDPGFSSLNRISNWDLTDIATLEISDAITLKNIFGYRSEKFASRQDLDSTPLPLITTGVALVPAAHTTGTRNEQATEELQVQGTTMSGQLNWVVGGFWQYNGPSADVNSNSSGQFGAFRHTYTRGQSRSQAFYAQATYDLSGVLLDGLKLTGGFRQTRDYRSQQQATFNNVGACIQLGADANCRLGVAAKFKSPSWTVGLDYQLTPTTLFYVASRRGYTAGGFNATVPTAEGKTFKPETNTDVEAGIKSDWDIGGHAVRTNAAFFRNWYRNVQRNDSFQFRFPDGSTQVVGLTTNAAKASVVGGEFSGTVVLSRAFEVSGNLSYVDASYDRYITLTGQDLGSTPFPAFPKTKMSGTATYHLPVATTLGRASLSASYAWRSKVYFAPDKQPGSIQGAYGTLDLRLDWIDAASLPVDLSLFATNVTNQEARIGSLFLYNSAGYVSSVWNEPRMYGVQLRYRFGPA